MSPLPNQLELQKLFSGFLFEAGLSSVSVKNYLSDLRHFLSFCASISSPDDPSTVQEIFQNITKYLNNYLDEQKRNFTPINTVNRRCASIRRFSTFLSSKFSLESDYRLRIKNHSQSSNLDEQDTPPTISKILEHYRVYLGKEKKSHSTIKNYISDLNHFFAWSANATPFIDQKLETILSENHLNTYLTYLKLNHTGTSVISRRQSSVKQFTRYCFLQKYLPVNPFEQKVVVPRLAPLSWFERLSKKNTPKTASRHPLALLYHKYNSLPFTPYLHLAILALATSAMVIFGYNQIIKQAVPSSAALPTVPRRQLSFQGRLTDSSGTPITTGVNVTFKLWNDPDAGTQLYTSGACSITPDTYGIFNTLIGNGTCGAEIANTVFTENRDVYLEVTVGAETLTPRQQIATVGYALNSETLQGYPASATATINTVPIVDNNGDINIAASSPSINSTSGTFNLNGQALTLTTTANSGGNIVLQPDAVGGGQVQILGGTTDTDSLRIENANLTSGALISGYIGNNTATGRLLSLTGGSTETDRFYVAASGQTKINTASALDNAGLIIDQNGTGDLFTASASGTTKFTIANNGNISASGTLTGLTGLTVASGTVSLPNSEINNAEISELDWTKLQNYPSACPAGQAIQAVGDTLTCVDVGGTQLWQRTDGSLAPLNITDSLNLGAVATGSALVHLAGTAAENSWINTGNFGIGDTTPVATLTVGSGDLFQVAGATGNITTAGDLAVNGDNINADGTLAILGGTGLTLQATTGTVTLDSDAASQTLNIGASNVARTLNLGTGTDVDTINIGTGATGADVITIGGGTGTLAINTGDWDISTTGAMSNIGAISMDGAITGATGFNGLVVTANTGVITTGTWNASLIPLAYGGTNKNLTPAAGGIVWTDADSMEVIAAGTPGQILSSNGANAPSWIDAPTGGTGDSAWTWDTGVLYPKSISDAVNLGNAATASATVHLAGKSGDNSFINTGNFGIGTPTPGTALDVSGVGRFSTGLTLTSGVISLTSTSGALSLAGLSASSIDSGANALTFTSSNFNTTSTGINSTNIGATTPGTGAFTTLSSTGITALGNNSATVAVNSSAWDISTTGAASGFTGISSSGNIDLSALSSGGIVKAEATTGRLAIATGGTDYEYPLTFSNGLTRSVNAVKLGGTLTASTDIPLGGFNLTFSGSGKLGVGTDSPGSTLTVVGTVNTSGGNVSINDSSNYTTAINTGSSTGAVTIGGNSNTVAVNSSSWDINTSGVASGLTGIESSGLITLTGLTASRAVFTDPSKNLVSTATSQYLIDSISNETGSGVLVFDTAPTFTTNITTPSILAAGDLTIDPAGGDVNLGSNDNLGLSAAANLIFGGTTSLGETTAANDSGAYLVGVYDEFTYSNGNNVQAVLNDLDAQLALNSNWWQRTDGSLAPLNITDSLNLGAVATGSALVHLAGTAAENSWINTGNFGIGDTTPVATLTVGSGDLFQVAGATGNITTAGDLAVNGGDITSTGALNITPGGALTVGATTQAATLQGSTLALTSNGSGNDITLTSADQIILNSTGTIELQDATNVTGNLTVTGNVLPGADLTYYLGSSTQTWLGAYLASIYNENGTETISVSNRRLANGDWNVTTGGLRIGDTAALDANYKLQVMGNATVSGTLGIGTAVQFTPLAASSSNTKGTLYYDNDINHLYLNTDGTSAFHRLAMDMTKYTSTDTIANRSYLEIAHNQNTNDLSLTAWVKDTITGLWQKISTKASTILHNLDNQFNPSSTQKEKVTSVAINTANTGSPLVYGTGADGDITVSSDTVINTTSLISGRSCADGGDAVNYSVTALTSTTATLSTTPSTGCLAVGDEVLLINLQGTSTNYVNVGNYETLRIGSISTSTITFSSAKKRYYGDNPGDDTNLGTATTNQRVMLQRVPNYRNVTVNSGIHLNPMAWNGTKGGVLFFKASGSITNNSGYIEANYLGYRGGAGGVSANPSDGGESFCGNPGGGGGGDADNNPADTAGTCGGGGAGGANQTTSNAGSSGSSTGGAGGGGGTGATSTTYYGFGGGGGGGGYGAYGLLGTKGRAVTSATDGTNGGTNTSGTGGNGGYTASSGNGAAGGGGGGGGTYGDSTLSLKLFLGSGGAGGGAGDSSNTGVTYTNGGAGGEGGGIVSISAPTITTTGSISIQTAGRNGYAGANTTYSGAGGAGAGGSIQIIGDSVTLGTGLVTSPGGTGSTSGAGDGGNGGDGIIAVTSPAAISGTTTPTYSSTGHIPGSYAIFVSEEINTPSATSFGNLAWTQSLNTYGHLSLQTRSGATPDSTDGTWEGWVPSFPVNVSYLDSMDSSDANWAETNLTDDNAVSTDPVRNVAYFEDEDLLVPTNKYLKLQSVGSTDGYAERTISSRNIGTTGYDYISAWVYATASGDIILGFGESAGTEQSETITIDDANTWQKIYWDLADIASGSRDAVTKLRITIPSPNQTIYLDDIKVETLRETNTGSTISSTANNYIQYRVILSTTHKDYSPTFSQPTIGYTSSILGTVTVDANSINLVGDPTTYASDRLTLTTTQLDDLKSYRTVTSLTGVSQSGDYDPGTGADGDITVSSDTVINTTSLISGRSCADGGDAVNYSVTALTSTTATLSTTPSTGCLAVGDEVLLINLQGAPSSYDNVGNYETLRVSSITGPTITFKTAKTKFYGNNAGDDTNLGIIEGTQRVMLQRVPNYRNVTVNSSKTLTPSAWDGVKGGVIFFRATGEVSVSGTISAAGLGYRGPNANSLNGGLGGESFCSLEAGGDGGTSTTKNGVCGGGGGAYKGTTDFGIGSETGGAGGGGGKGGDDGGASSFDLYGGGGAGGGGYTPGKLGTQFNPPSGDYAIAENGGTNTSGDGGYINIAGSTSVHSGGGGGGGGGSYPSLYTNRLAFGSSGGSGGGTRLSSVNYSGGAGGSGGGIIHINASTISVSGSLTAKGANGSNGSSYAGSGGGGGGGSVRIIGNTLSLGSSLVDSSGGDGGTAGYDGGEGGDGLIETYYANTISGSILSTNVSASVPAYNYAVFISDEQPTPNATELNKLTWSADLSYYGHVEFQTRTGPTPNSTDGTWEPWTPASASAAKKIDSGSKLNMNTHTDWTGTNLTVSDGGTARNVDFYEDEDESTTGNMTTLSSVGSANGYAEATITSLDTTGYDYLSAWVYATQSGNVVKFGLGESAATEQEKIFSIDQTNTWQKIFWDLRDIDATQRNALTKVRVSVLTTNNTVYLDNISFNRFFTDSSQSNIASTPNSYLQYRAILTTTLTGYRPTLHNVQVEWNNGYKVIQTDANTVRLYNFSGQSQDLRLDAVVFGADLAEYYTVNDQSIGAADVVSITGNMDDSGVPILQRSTTVNDTGLIGVISTKAGQTLGLEAPDRRLLALAGRVPVKVSTASAAIKYGDQLTSSFEAGRAKKATFGQRSIGTALEAWDPASGKDTLMILVGNSSIFTPALADLNALTLTAKVNAEKISYELTDSLGETINNLGVFSDLLAANLKAGLAVITDLTTDNLAVRQKLITPFAEIDNLKVIDATVSGTLYADHIQGETIDLLQQEIGLLSHQYSTASAILAELQARYSSYNSLVHHSENTADPLTLSPLATTSATLPTDLALNSLNTQDLITKTLLANSSIFTSSLASFEGDLFIQPTADRPVRLLGDLMSLFPNGKVLINGDLLVTGTLIAESLDTKTATISGSLAIGSSRIASQSANFDQLTTTGLIIAADSDPLATISGITTSNTTIGTATLLAGNTEVSILNRRVTPTTLIYITPTSDTNGRVLYVKSKTENLGFTVAVSGSSDSSTISFNYWLVETK